MIFALSGIILSIFFVFLTLKINGLLKLSLESTKKIIEESLLTTNEGFDVINNMLLEADESFELMDKSLEDIGTTLENLTPFLESTSTIIGDDFSIIIEDAQVSLDSTAEGSQLIDATLSLLASIPFIDLDYQPEVPLHTGLENLSNNLENIPSALRSIKTNLLKSADDIDSLSQNLHDLSEELLVIDENIVEARSVIDQYKGITLAIQVSLDNAYQIALRWLTIITIALLLWFAWLLLFQLGLLSLAYQLGRENKAI